MKAKKRNESIRISFSDQELDHIKQFMTEFAIPSVQEFIRSLIQDQIKLKIKNKSIYGRVEGGGSKKPKELRAIEFIKDLEENKSLEEIDNIIRPISSKISEINFGNPESSSFGYYFKIVNADDVPEMKGSYKGRKVIAIYQPDGNWSSSETIEDIVKKAINKKLIDY